MRTILLIIFILLISSQSDAQVVTTSSGGNVLTTSGKPVTIGPASRVSLVATGSVVLPQSHNTTASQTGMTRKAHYNRSNSTRFQALYGNFWVPAATNNFIGQEAANGNAIAICGWIEYPVGTYTPWTFSGTSCATTPFVLADLSIATSDFINVSIPKDALFYTWTHIAGSGGNNFPFIFSGVVGNPLWFQNGGQEKGNFGTSGVPTSPSSGMSDNGSGRNAYTELAILGDQTQPTFALVGDSRMWGTNDLEDSSYDLGEVARSVGPTNAYINMGVSGDRMAAYFNNHTLRDSIISTVNPSVIIDQLFVNEFNQQSSTTAMAEAISQNLIAHMVNTFPTIPIFRTTISPWTTSTDSFATPMPVNWGVNCGNQTGTSYNANLTTENQHIRSGAIDSLPYVEIANATSTAVNSGCWKANGLNNYFTNGGHESAAGNILIESSGSINTRNLAATSPIAYSYPPSSLSGFTPSYTTGPFSNTQAAIFASGNQLTGLGLVPGTPPMTYDCQVQITTFPNNIFLKAVIGIFANSGTDFIGYKDIGGTNHTSSTAFGTGAFHHLEMDAGSASSGANVVYTVYYDGTSIGSTTTSTNATQYLNNIGLVLGGTGFVGDIAECALWNIERHTTNFTPPSSPYSGNEAGLVGVWHMNGNLNFVRGPAGM